MRADAPPVAELRSVVKSYREGDRIHRVLDGTDLSLRRGEIVFLRGRSGAGKSTLLHLLAGIDTPDEGAVVLGGRDLRSLSERERTLARRDTIGFVFQFFNLLPTLSVLENLLLPLELQRRLDGGGRKRALDLLAAVGLGDRRDAFPDRLSGGEQQRVALARALVHEPALVLADEPTGNLDAATGRTVLDLLRDLVRDRATTLLLVSHSREGIEMADRVIELREGRIHPPDREGGG